MQFTYLFYFFFLSLWQVEYDVKTPSGYDVYEATLTFKDDQEEVGSGSVHLTCNTFLVRVCYVLGYKTTALRKQRASLQSRIACCLSISLQINEESRK